MRDVAAQSFVPLQRHRLRSGDAGSERDRLAAHRLSAVRLHDDLRRDAWHNGDRDRFRARECAATIRRFQPVARRCRRRDGQ